jgi:ribosome-binding protein aMBF1 (putative translation factor)
MEEVHRVLRAHQSKPDLGYRGVRSIHDPRYLEIVGRLRRAREDRGVGQGELGARLGRPQSYVSKIETGERRVDLIETLDICRALGIQLDVLVPAELRPSLTEASGGD